MNCSAKISCFLVENPAVFSHQVLINCVASGSFWTIFTLARLDTQVAAPDGFWPVWILFLIGKNQQGKHAEIISPRASPWLMLPVISL